MRAVSLLALCSAAHAIIGGNHEKLMRRDFRAAQSDETSENDTKAAAGFHSNKDYAIVTHICSDQWAPGALALAASLRSVGSRAETVILVTPSVGEHFVKLLENNFDRVVLKKAFSTHPSITRPGADCLTLQLYTWQLPYKKALYLDADMIMLKNPDRLFEQYGELTARMDSGKHWVLPGRTHLGFNGGMFMCRPNATTYSILLSSLTTYGEGNVSRGLEQWSGMQPFLNHMFPPCNTSHLANHSVAGCLSGTFSQAHNYFTRDLTMTEAALLSQGGETLYESLHFSGDWGAMRKPWMSGCLMNASSTTTKGGVLQEQILNIWMRAYRQVMPVKGKETMLRVDCPFFYACGKEKEKAMDFVVHTSTIDCVTKSMLVSVQRYARPRRILLIGNKIVKDACQRSDMKGVNCIDEAEVMTGMSSKNLTEWLLGRSREWNKSSLTLNKSTLTTVQALVAELHEQFVKMGIANASQHLGLSDNYVLLDSDMILIRDFCPFNNQGHGRIFSGQPEDFSKKCAKSQQLAFERLTRFKHPSPDNHPGAPAEAMVVNKKRMLNLLKDIQAKSSATHWSEAILNSACTDLGTCRYGVRIQSLYPAWMSHTNPAEYAAVSRQYRTIVPGVTLVPSKDFMKPCCPDSYEFAGDGDLGEGHQFVKFQRCGTRLHLACQA